MAKAKKETPLMAQYLAIKRQYPDAILLFRVGDFYETFGQDAVTASQVLGIVLTKRANGSASEVALAGFPHHSLEAYMPKLVKAGYRVAICDQLEDPKATKGIVKRGVTELISPGCTTATNVLDPNSNNFLAAVYQTSDCYGIACLDLSTADFSVTEGNLDDVQAVVGAYLPSEILIAKPQLEIWKSHFPKHNFYQLEDWIFTQDFAEDILIQQFKTEFLKAFSLEDRPVAQMCAGAVLHYVQSNKLENLSHIRSIQWLDLSEFVWLDPFTIRNLEMFQSYQASGTSLFEVIKKTRTSLGARLLKQWLAYPLKSHEHIQDRLSVVDAFYETDELEEITDTLSEIQDLERLVSKLALRKIQPKEFQSLAQALIQVQDLASLLKRNEVKRIKRLGEDFSQSDHISSPILSGLLEDCPALLVKGNVIADGVNDDLDEYRSIRSNAKSLLAELQAREIEQTGIPSLKVGFNNVFGYYLEVTKTHQDKVPEEWTRKQTLTNAERYITSELKDLEEKILEADSKIQVLEEYEYAKLIENITPFIPEIQSLAKMVAKTDVLSSFAILANQYAYCKPDFSEEPILEIEEGRHPVIEQTLPIGKQYIPNSVKLDQEHQILMITGPNMSGKSAVLRQTALISILAQIGSFVPAKSARLSIVDKIFTRVGASDNLSAGESTFMVEMLETAGIMHNITSNSLVILDEIGRGTSTFDGVSIAWSIAEYLHQNKKAHPKTLFATHYHELNVLAEEFERIHNYHIETRETGNTVLFLRKLKPGPSNHSFGIQVAEMSGMPMDIVLRAKEVLHHLESLSQENSEEGKTSAFEAPPPSNQLFTMPSDIGQSIVSELEILPIDSMSPMDVFMKVNEWKHKLKK